MRDDYWKVMQFGKIPKLNNPVFIEGLPGIGNVGNPKCGDIMRLFIKVRDGRIEDVKFKTFGCAAAIATSSIITEMIKGKALADLKDITNKAVAEALGGLPNVKLHCSVLAEDALKAAIEDYYRKQGIKQDEVH